MALVKAPNGDVYDLNDSVASGLVGGSSGWSYVKPEPSAVNRKGKVKTSEEVVAEPETVVSVEKVTAE